MSRFAIVLAGLLAMSWIAPASAQQHTPDGAPPGWPEPVMDDEIFSFFEVDRLEYRARDGKDGYLWDAQGWIGGDYERLWLKAEGEGAFGGKLERAEFQALYGRLITPFLDLQAGVRYDARPRPTRGYAVLGIEGKAPYGIELDSALFLSEKGDLTARIEAEYDFMLTQRLVLQPRAEVNLAAQDVRELGIGAGLDRFELGLRLRYEIVREVAPYIGVSWEQRVGDSADFARDEGEDPGSVGLVAGIRLWY